MKPYDFSYIRATSLDHLYDLFDEYGEGLKILAGGQSLITTLNMRLSAPEILVDINDLNDISSISVKDNIISVGALARHADIQESSVIKQHVPLLKLAIEHVAHAAIRNRGTHGGSIAFADPAAEIPACVLALNATLVLVSREGERRIAASDFFKDLYDTELRENEILIAIEYPKAKQITVSAFREFTRRKGDFASVGLALGGELDGKVFQSLSLAFFGVANTPVLAKQAAELIVGEAVTLSLIEKAQGLLADDINVIGDLYSSEEMKLHLSKHYLKEVIDELVG
jgi:aerobic carbon-monoxide dehydrogenase medium subunit